MHLNNAKALKSSEIKTNPVEVIFLRELLPLLTYRIFLSCFRFCQFHIASYYV